MFSKNPQLPTLMGIRPVGPELFHADGRTDLRDEVSSRFFAIFRKRLTKTNILYLSELGVDSSVP
jgi:hypothetical protein